MPTHYLETMMAPSDAAGEDADDIVGAGILAVEIEVKQ